MSAPFEIRPTLRRAKFGAFVAVLLLGLLAFGYYTYRDNVAWWILFAGIIPFIPPLIGWLDHRRTRISLVGPELIFQSSLVGSKPVRVPLHQVRDIRVERSLSQRTWGIGTLVIDLAGVPPRIVLPDVDRPLRVAEALRESVRGYSERGDATVA